VDDHEDILRKLAICDDAFVESILAGGGENLRASHLDPKTHALVRIAALVGTDAAAPSYMPCVEEALAHGATPDEIVGTLVAVMPSLGCGRVVSAAPRLGLAIGFDVGGALEGTESESGRPRRLSAIE